MKATARAHTNIALIKYWGKRDDKLILPMNNSLSLTLDGFYTTTTVTFSEELSQDNFFLNEQAVTGEQSRRVSAFLDVIRDETGVTNWHADVRSINHVPTAAGFASSASGFAALAAAAVKALNVSISDQELSKITRRGSGSACRSIYGGFVEWKKGNKEDGSDSFAVQVQDANIWDVRVAAVVLSETEKNVSSREGMKRTVTSSPFYTGWMDSIPKDLEQIKAGIAAHDIEQVGSIAEANCLKMHATMLGANPPVMYWHDTTVRVMQEVQAMREQGIPAYFTIDAGPNVKVLYLPNDEAQVITTLRNIPGVQEVITSRPGQGVTYL
ncbi:diphosphomevalonate decarboxylase [Lentibacillus sp. N15]|uniref:diphosphomevalonate decarboxylase n=1 Tax=Lentibacillus songyuanensis TaxID=3136161 RepID=UPI0031BA1E82